MCLKISAACGELLVVAGIAKLWGSFGAATPVVWKLCWDNHWLWEFNHLSFSGTGLPTIKSFVFFWFRVIENQQKCQQIVSHPHSHLCGGTERCHWVTQHPGFCHLGEIKQKFSWQEIQCFHCWQTNIFNEGKILKLLLKHDAILYICIYIIHL